ALREQTRGAGFEKRLSTRENGTKRKGHHSVPLRLRVRQRVRERRLQLHVDDEEVVLAQYVVCTRERVTVAVDRRAGVDADELGLLIEYVVDAAADRDGVVVLPDRGQVEVIGRREVDVAAVLFCLADVPPHCAQLHVPRRRPGHTEVV